MRRGLGTAAGRTGSARTGCGAAGPRTAPRAPTRMSAFAPVRCLYAGEATIETWSAATCSSIHSAQSWGYTAATPSICASAQEDPHIADGFRGGVRAVGLGGEHP